MRIRPDVIVLSEYTAFNWDSEAGALFIQDCRTLPPSLPSSHVHITMIIILAVLAATRASPVGLLSPHLVSLDRRQTVGPGSSCDDPDGCRSLADIIRSCVLTILLCTWVSMHPNIPSPDERWPRVALRRVGLMLLALLVPEAVVAWALRQRQAAAGLAEKHKGRSQTLRSRFNGDHQTQERDGPSPTVSSRPWVVLWSTKETGPSEYFCPIT